MHAAAARIDQLPAWAFMALGAAALGMARAGRLFGLLQRNPGTMELFGIVTMAVFLCIVIFAVRRRQVRAGRSAAQVLAMLVAGNALGILIVWPLVPSGYDLSLAPMLRETLVSGVGMMVFMLPLAIALLWLSRRFGSHSQLTERRHRVIREQLRRRYRRQRADV